MHKLYWHTFSTKAGQVGNRIQKSQLRDLPVDTGSDNWGKTPGSSIRLTAFEKSRHPTPRSKVPRPITCSVTRLTESHTLTWGCKGCAKATGQMGVTSGKSVKHRLKVMSSNPNCKLWTEMQMTSVDAAAGLYFEPQKARVKTVSAHHVQAAYIKKAFGSYANKSQPNSNHWTKIEVILHFKPQT